MKLAYLVSQYPAANHAFMLHEIRRLRQLGFEIAVASISTPDRPSEKLTKEELEASRTTFYVKRAGVARAATAHLAEFLSRPVRYTRTLFYALKLGDWHPLRTFSALLYFVEAVIAGRWILQQGAKHFHVHYSSTVALLIVRQFPLTFSVTFHGPDEFNDPVGFRLGEKIRAGRFICAISNYARSQLMRASSQPDWAKMEVVPLGVDTAALAPRAFRADPQPFRIVCAGRLAPVKGQHVLIAALDALVRRKKDVVLHLAGSGPDRADLEKDAAARGVHNRVVFEGLLNPAELKRVYGESDVMALASFAEGVPVVLMEAMSMEIPCVATWVAGIPELIENMQEGLLVPPGDDTALADAIERLMNDPGLRHRIGLAGRQKVLRSYDLDRNGTMLAEIFRKWLSQATSPS